MTKQQTESISVRVDSELKREFFEYLDANNMSFSKWIRDKMSKDLDEKLDGNK